MLMFVGRYGRQDAVAMQERISMRTLSSWAARVNELLEREQQSIPKE